MEKNCHVLLDISQKSVTFVFLHRKHCEMFAIDLPWKGESGQTAKYGDPYLFWVIWFHTYGDSLTHTLSLSLSHTHTHTHTHTHQWAAIFLCCGTRGAVVGSVPCSRVLSQSWYWRWRGRWLFTPRRSEVDSNESDPLTQRSSTLLLGTHSPRKFISNRPQHTCLQFSSSLEELDWPLQVCLNRVVAKLFRIVGPQEQGWRPVL